MNLSEDVCNLMNVMPCAVLLYDIEKNYVSFCNGGAEDELGIHVGDTAVEIEGIIRNISMGDGMNNALRAELRDKNKCELKNIFVSTKYDKNQKMDLNISFVDAQKDRVYLVFSRSENEFKLMKQQKLYYDSISSASYSYPFYLNIKARHFQVFDVAAETYNMSTVMENYPEPVLKSGYLYEDDVDAYLETIDRMYQGKPPKGSFRFYDSKGELLRYTVNYVVHRNENNEPIEISGDFIAQSEAKMKNIEEVFDDETVKSQHKMVLAHQIKAHFFFNTLNTISALCKQDAMQADRAVQTFARYMRSYMHLISEEENIEFMQELELVKSTLEIEKLRFTDSFTYELDLQETSFEIPPLSIQPIVENALLHGLRRTGNHGHLKISSYQDDDMVKISVKDNGPGFAFDTSVLEKRSSIGLRNLRKRIELMVGGSLIIDSVLGKGTEVVIEIPVW